MALFESYERRIDKINGVLAQYGIGSVEECREMCKAKGFDPYEITKSIQPICFDNAAWAYCVGAAIALKAGVKTAADAARKIGEGLQAFCIDGSVADDRKVGLGHGNLGAMLLSEDSKCFAFLAGHESFAAAEGAIGIVKNANKARKEPLRVILNGLGKDAAQIISRINGFTYVQTQFDYATSKLNIVREVRYSEGERHPRTHRRPQGPGRRPAQRITKKPKKHTKPPFPGGFVLRLSVCTLEKNFFREDLSCCQKPIASVCANPPQKHPRIRRRLRPVAARPAGRPLLRVRLFSKGTLLGPRLCD